MMMMMAMMVVAKTPTNVSVRVSTRIHGRVIHWRRSNVHGSRRDNDRCGAYRSHGDAHGRRSDDDPRNGNGNSNIDANRYAGTRRGGTCGSEGDCDCTD